MLAGQPPFGGDTALQVAVQHLRTEPAPLAQVRSDLPPALCELIHKMLAKEPEDRFATAHEIVAPVAVDRRGLRIDARRTCALFADRSACPPVPASRQALTGQLQILMRRPPPPSRMEAWRLAAAVVLSRSCRAGGGLLSQPAGCCRPAVPPPTAVAGRQRPRQPTIAGRPGERWSPIHRANRLAEPPVDAAEACAAHPRTAATWRFNRPGDGLAPGRGGRCARHWQSTRPADAHDPSGRATSGRLRTARLTMRRPQTILSRLCRELRRKGQDSRTLARDQVGGGRLDSPVLLVLLRPVR